MDLIVTTKNLFLQMKCVYIGLPEAAITKYHKLGDFNNQELVFAQFEGRGEYKIARCWQVWFLEHTDGHLLTVP